MRKTIACAAALILVVVGVLLGVVVARVIVGPDFSHYHSRYLDPQALYYSGPTGLQTTPCHCRMSEGICPCTSPSRNPSYDHVIWSQLEAVVPTTLEVEDVDRTIVEATGYDVIKPLRSDGGGRLEPGGRSSFADGRLEEIFMVYDRPRMRVRALYARRLAPAKSLLIVTPGSWSTSEHIMGLKPVDYHLKMGRDLFDKGIDVVVFDHGSNGHTEALSNVMAVVEGGQIIGLWARSVCDMISTLELRRKYERLVFYGLSRGGRMAEFVSALCPGFDLVISGDHFTADQYSAYHWNSMLSAPYLKYGAWFLHRHPLVGRFTKADMMHAAKSPMVYTRSERRHRDNLKSLEADFSIRDELSAESRWRLVFKTIDKHVPELELIEQMVAGSWSGLKGVALTSRREGRK